MTTPLRRCRKCGIEKDAAGFSHSTNPSVWCRDCCRENARAWRAKNLERAREFDRQRSDRQRTPEGRRWQFEYRLQFKYGLTREQYDALALAQEGRCALCDRISDLVIDHCHDSQRIRGLLCTTCNRLLSFIGDNQEKIERAIRYFQAGAVEGAALLTNPIEELEDAAFARQAIREGSGRRYREAAGLKRVDVARVCGVTRSTVSEWEAGRQPRGSLAVAYGKALRALARGTLTPG